MSVYVKGMEMPTSCAQCACCDDEARFCHAAHQYIPMIGKPKFCPLVEVPTHGKRTEQHGMCSDDLISRQAAIDALDCINGVEEVLRALPTAQPELPEWAHKVEEYCQNTPSYINNPLAWALYQVWKEYDGCNTQRIYEAIKTLPSVQPEPEKYEYHYDHTDCIWYRPEARNRCPVTCAQYRDGWNDAMNYIFRGGKGYMPYRRDKQYGE